MRLISIHYIEVPDATKYINDFDTPFTMFTYEHLYHFTPDVMKQITNQIGLKNIELGQFDKSDSISSLYGVYKKSNEVLPINYSDESYRYISEYIENCRMNLKSRVDRFERDKTPIILWGIGMSTALLLVNTFDNCNVTHIVDRNKARQGIEYTIGKKTYIIEDPEALLHSKENLDLQTIIILPTWYRKSIYQQIQDMGFKCKVATLSDC